MTACRRTSGGWKRKELKLGFSGQPQVGDGAVRECWGFSSFVLGYAVTRNKVPDSCHRLLHGLSVSAGHRTDVVSIL